MPPESGTGSSISDVAAADQALLGSMNAFTDAVQSGGRDEQRGEQRPAETATPSPAPAQSDSRPATPPATAGDPREAAPLGTEPKPGQEPALPEEGTEEGTVAEGEQELIHEPFSYRADQRDIPFEGISLVKDPVTNEVLGATIDKEQIDSLRLRLGRHDHLVGENTRLNGRVQEYDRFTHQGLDRQQYQGAAAIQQLWVENAKLAATVAILARVVDNPETLTAIVTEATNNLPPREWQMIQRELATAARDAEGQARRSWTMRTEQARNSAEMAPDALSGMLSNHFDTLHRSTPELKNLKPEDLAEARTTFAPFASQIVRRATAEDVRAQPELSLGQVIVDQSKFQDWFNKRVELRDREAAASSSTSAAARENTARVRAANAGKPAAAAARTASGRTNQPAKSAEAELPTWDQFRTAWMQGQYVMDQPQDT